MASIKITLPDNSSKDVESGISAKDFIKIHIGEGLARAALAVSINDELKDLSAPLTESCKFTVHTWKDAKGKEVFWHSSAHILAIATLRLFPNTKLTIGPAIEEGFYYDFHVDKPFTPEDILKIEAEMEKVIKEDILFSREPISANDARKQFADNPFKMELIKEFTAENSQLTIYKTGAFSDLCRGPHVESTGKVKAIKLTKTSGAYWRGKAENPQLQRLYGISFPNKDDLKVYLERLELARGRDHRKLAKEHNLVMFHEYAPGMPFFLSKGAVIYNELIAFIREEYKKRGYQEVITPQIFNKKLWETSGHWEHYKDDMFVLNVDGQEASLKPMNCPSHCLIYANSAKSYRDLPLRIADFCNLHRNELSGALSGMTRVRKFSQDDAHIFCTMEQIEGEVLGVLQFIKYVWEDIFGFKLNYSLSTRPEKKYLGTPELWTQAEGMLAAAMQKANIQYNIKAGDGAFYGPKIDIDMEDALGRKWQCPTCQLDFNLPKRFELEYEGADAQRHTPVMIHRAVLGSLERCFAMLVENYAGKFPLWLSPVQVKILPIADRHNEYVFELKKQFIEAGIRADVDTRSLTTSNKVRQAQEEQVNYILVVGDQEIKNKTANVRTRNNEVLGEKSVVELIADLKSQIAKFK